MSGKLRTTTAVLLAFGFIGAEAAGYCAVVASAQSPAHACCRAPKQKAAKRTCCTLSVPQLPDSVKFAGISDPEAEAALPHVARYADPGYIGKPVGRAANVCFAPPKRFLLLRQLLL